MTTLRAGDPVRNLAALTVRPVIQLPDTTEPPKEFRIFSVGVNATEKGPFLWDAIAAATCMAFWSGKGVELSMDWEHQALADPPVQAPASAWWTPEIRDGDLWATNVRWTPDADQQIRKKEYRYFSPAFTFDALSTRPERIINCALTNIPAMDRIEPLVAANAIAAAATTAKETKDMEELAALKAKYDAQVAKFEALSAEVAGLRTQLTAKTEECSTLTAKLNGMSDDEKELSTVVGLRFDAPRTERKSTIAALSAAASELRQLTGQSSDAAAIATLRVMKADAAETTKLRAELAQMEEHSVQTELKSVQDEGIASGKFPPAADHPRAKVLMEGALGIGQGKMTRAGVAWLRSAIATSDVLVRGTETAPRSATHTGSVISPTRLEIARQMGRDRQSVEEFEAKQLQGR